MKRAAITNALQRFLPLTPPSHLLPGPDTPLPRVSICAIFRNEALYLREWIEFHLLVGVEMFSLYQNNSDDDYLAVLRPYIERGVVELVEWPMPSPSQFAAYQHYIDRHKEGWTAFIDCDEFLWSPRFETVPEALRRLPQSAIGVNWMCFGWSGEEAWRDAPVIERFTWRDVADHPENVHVKCVIRMDQRVRVGKTPHKFKVGHGTFNEHGRRILGPFSPHSSSILRINHYATKSREEWKKRTALGKPDRALHKIDHDALWASRSMDVDDREIQRYLPRLKQRLQQCP